jgi:hypothetical protein
MKCDDYYASQTLEIMQKVREVRIGVKAIPVTGRGGL